MKQQRIIHLEWSAVVVILISLTGIVGYGVSEYTENRVRDAQTMQKIDVTNAYLAKINDNMTLVLEKQQQLDGRTTRLEDGVKSINGRVSTIERRLYKEADNGN